MMLTLCAAGGVGRRIVGRGACRAAPCCGSICCWASGPSGWALGSPARQALLPQLVPAELFSNAVAWNSSVFYIASVTGPAVGGVVVAMSDNLAPAFALVLVCRVIAVAAIALDSPSAAEPCGTVDLLGKRGGRHPLRLEHQAHPGHDHARPVRRAAGRSDLSAAGLCRQNPARRRVGAWAFSSRPTPSAPSAWPCCWPTCRPCDARA